MPHVEINCYPGRTEEVKQKCAEKIAEDVAAALGCNLSSVSVTIREVYKPSQIRELSCFYQLINQFEDRSEIGSAQPQYVHAAYVSVKL